MLPAVCYCLHMCVEVGALRGFGVTMENRSSEGGAVQTALSIRPASTQLPTSGPIRFYGCGPKAGKGSARCSHVGLSQHLDY